MQGTVKSAIPSITSMECSGNISRFQLRGVTTEFLVLLCYVGVADVHAINADGHPGVSSTVSTGIPIKHC